MAIAAEPALPRRTSRQEAAASARERGAEERGGGRRRAEGGGEDDDERMDSSPRLCYPGGDVFVPADGLRRHAHRPSLALELSQVVAEEFEALQTAWGLPSALPAHAGVDGTTTQRREAALGVLRGIAGRVQRHCLRPREEASSRSCIALEREIARLDARLQELRRSAEQLPTLSRHGGAEVRRIVEAQLREHRPEPEMRSSINGAQLRRHEQETRFLALRRELALLGALVEQGSLARVSPAVDVRRCLAQLP
mmetsp:Transcript_33937/g.93685  ORF Transcript_33937/g.93685 Transcript_33937/m.93685 type:complete len:253 (-) Transcript_33937:47-805(-)